MTVVSPQPSSSVTNKIKSSIRTVYHPFRPFFQSYFLKTPNKLHRLVCISCFTLLISLASAQIKASTNESENGRKPHLADALIVSKDIAEKFKLADDSRLSDPKLFRELLAELSQLRSQFTRSDQQFFNYLQGYHYAYTGEHKKSEAKLKSILASSNDVQLKFRANHTLINLSAINHKWAEGLQYIADNNDMLEYIDNKELLQKSILAIVIFYSNLRQYDLALEQLAKLEKHNLSLYSQCFVEKYRLESQLYLKQLTSSDKVITDAITLCDSADNKTGLNSIRRIQALLFLEEQKPEQALALLIPHLEEIDNTLFPMLIAAINNIIAQAYLQLNDLDNAKQAAEEAVALNEFNTGVERARESYQVLYQVAEQQQDFELALEHFKVFSQLDKAFLDEVKTKHLAFQLAQHKSLEQVGIIELLYKKNNTLTSEQALAQIKLRNIQLGLIVLILLLGIFSVWAARLWRAHQRVKILSESDDLTGIYNRRHFTYVAVSALRYCKTAQQDLSVIMFDLDHFKLVNDNYGHACGDWALKETIKVCQAVGKTSDIFSRLGGEEFCLVLPSCGIDEAKIRAESCRVAIENIITEASGGDFSITASFGVTDIKRSGFRLAELLKDADTAMYQAKEAGRNQVVLFEPKVKETLDSSWGMDY